MPGALPLKQMFPTDEARHFSPPLHGAVVEPRVVHLVIHHLPTVLVPETTVTQARPLLQAALWQLCPSVPFCPGGGVGGLPEGTLGANGRAGSRPGR